MRTVKIIDIIHKHYKHTDKDIHIITNRDTATTAKTHTHSCLSLEGEKGLLVL